MQNKGAIRYKVECMSCGRRFIVDQIGATVPKHPPKGQAKKRLYPFIPCIGSGTTGVFVKTAIKGLD